MGGGQILSFARGFPKWPFFIEKKSYVLKVLVLNPPVKPRERLRSALLPHLPLAKWIINLPQRQSTSRLDNAVYQWFKENCANWPGFTFCSDDGRVKYSHQTQTPLPFH
jgi:hypothetical protein